MAEKSDTVTPLKHLVIMPDGDRRWAKANGLPPTEGHRDGFIQRIYKIKTF